MILVDIYEPVQIENLVAQSVPVTRLALNPKGFADYMFYGVDGHRIQVERKQIDEILSDMDGVEEQLRRELQNGVEETILLYEGTFEPIAGLKMATQSWRKAKEGRIMIPGHKYNINYSGIQAWFSQLDKAGITIVHTCDYVGTAMTLVALYNNSQKEEHTTLRRYIKDRVYPEPYNPYILTLMGIKNAAIGEEKAKALIDRYGTPWYIFNQSIEDIAETLVGKEDKTKKLGVPSAKKLLMCIGREL